jgi:hypothetical protein
VILERQEQPFDTKVIWVDGGYSGQNFARVVISSTLEQLNILIWGIREMGD